MLFLGLAGRFGGLLLALCLFTLSAYPQGGSISSGGILVLSPLGRPIGGATVTVCAFGATGIPCSPTITVYTDPTLVTPASNPATSDGNGNVFVYAAPGRYTYTVTGTGITGKSFTATVAGSGGGDVGTSFNNVLTGNNTIASPGSLTVSGTTTLAILNCKSFEGVRCVDTTNTQGWTGSDPGQWINSAMTAAASGGTGGIVWVMPGNYATTATTIALTGPATLILQGANLFSTASPNISVTGNGVNVVGMSRNISTLVNNGTGITIQVATNSSFETFRDFLINSHSTGDGFQFGDNARDISVENVQIQMNAAGGHCAQQVAGASGTEFNRFIQVWCTASASPAFNFDNSGGTNAGNWEYFENVFAVSVSSPGIGFLVANGSATFVRTSTDTSTIGYQFGAATNGVARISMENTDAEGDTTGINIVGAGDYTIKHHNCGTISGTCIVVNSAGANTTIIDPASQATVGANDITYSAASTGRHILIGGAGLGKAVLATAPAVYTNIATDVNVPGRISAGGLSATGSTTGDVTAQRGATSGVYYIGSDGTVFLFRSSGNSSLAQLGGAGIGFAEISNPGGLANQDTYYGDATTHTPSWNNNNNGVSSPSGAWQCTNVTPVTVNANVATDQNLMACTIPAGTLNRVGRTLRVKVAGIYSTPAASTAQMTVKIKLCTVSGCGSGTVISPLSIQSAALATAQVTNQNFSLRGELTSQTAGASSAYEAHGEYLINLANLSTTAADSVFGDTNTATVGTIDSTAQLFLQVTFTFSAASASNSATQRQLIAETVN